jgi:hypothetical protein
LADGDKEHDPRVGERRFVSRNGSRIDAMHASVRLRARAPSATAD